jgi:hypothetical protein
MDNFVDPFDSQVQQQAPSANTFVDPFDAHEQETARTMHPSLSNALAAGTTQDRFNAADLSDRQQAAADIGAQAPKDATPFGTQVLAEFADQPQAKIVSYAHSRFPNMPINEAVKRYGVMNNAIVFVGDDGHLYKEDEPGLGASLIGNSLPIAGSVIGSATGAAVGGVPGAFAGNAAGSAIGELGRNAVASMILGQNKSPGDLALDAAGSGVGGLVGEGTGRLFAKGAAKLYDQKVPENVISDPQAIQNSRDAQARGYNLSQAEATQNKDSIKQEQALRGLPGSAEQFAQNDAARNPKIHEDVYKLLDTTAPAENVQGSAASIRDIARNTINKQDTDFNNQIYDQVNSQLDSVAPGDSVATAGHRIRQAAQQIIKNSEDTRSEAAEPFYQASSKRIISDQKVPYQSPLGDLSEVVRNPVMDQLKSDPVITKALSTVRGDPVYQKALGNMPDNSIQVLDTVKKVIDDQIEAAKRDGKNFRAGILLSSKKSLVNELDRISPSYHAAREAFSSESRNVDELNNGVIGKIANLSDSDLKKIPNIIFDASESNPSVLNQVKNLLTNQDPDAWNSLLRLHIESKLNKTSPGVGEGDNLTQFIKSTFANKKQAAMLQTALQDHPEIYTSFKDIAESTPSSALDKGIIGKIANLSDSQLESIPSILFNPKQTSPGVLEKTVDFFHGQNPDAWNAIVRNYLQSQFEGMRNDVLKGATVGKAFANQIMGSPQQQQLLYTALKNNPEALENLKTMSRILPLLGSAAAEGSPTAARQEVIAGMKGKNIYSIGRALTEPKQSLKNLFTNLETDKSKDIYKAMADAAINPQYADEMAALRKMNPGTKEAISAFTNLLTRIGSETAALQFHNMPNQPIPNQQ